MESPTEKLLKKDEKRPADQICQEKTRIDSTLAMLEVSWIWCRVIDCNIKIRTCLKACGVFAEVNKCLYFEIFGAAKKLQKLQQTPRIIQLFDAVRQEALHCDCIGRRIQGASWQEWSGMSGKKCKEKEKNEQMLYISLFCFILLYSCSGITRRLICIAFPKHIN